MAGPGTSVSCGRIEPVDAAALLPRAYLVWYHYGFRHKGLALQSASCGQVSGNNSVVECDLAKVEVAGSNPVSRSIN